MIEEVDDSNYVTESESGGEESIGDPSETQLQPFDPNAESFGERFYALKDMISPSTRDTIAGCVGHTFSWMHWTGMKIGGAAWIVTTSALLVGLPLMLSVEGESAVVAQEKEYMMQQGQQSVRLPSLSRIRLLTFFLSCVGGIRCPAWTSTGDGDRASRILISSNYPLYRN